jgi:hypothetical protein
MVALSFKREFLEAIDCTAIPVINLSRQEQSVNGKRKLPLRKSGAHSR